MSDIKTGGPAFPVFPETGGGHAAAFQGMTLRDYFAAKAMQGLLASEVEASMKEFAKKAYAMSDAMLEARGNK
jgi:polyhydroxyalkanoate synthesis regulator protein